MTTNCNCNGKCRCKCNSKRAAGQGSNAMQDWAGAIESRAWEVATGQSLQAAVNQCLQVVVPVMQASTMHLTLMLFWSDSVPRPVSLSHSSPCPGPSDVSRLTSDMHIISFHSTSAGSELRLVELRPPHCTSDLSFLLLFSSPEHFPARPADPAPGSHIPSQPHALRTLYYLCENLTTYQSSAESSSASVPVASCSSYSLQGSWDDSFRPLHA